MLAAYRRYAIYAAPAPGSDLARFGASWLGWDAEAGTSVAHPDVPGLPRPVAAITEQPRRYGFHGTMKAPFRPAPGQGHEALVEVLDGFAAARAPLRLNSGLRLAQLGRFLALVPAEEDEPLARLAADAVTAFESFRDQLTDAELARRRAAGLTTRQEALLLRWGYPYVMDEFRFHMTLTGPLEQTERAAVATVLSDRLAPMIGCPWVLDSLCLFAEAQNGYFRILHRAPFSSTLMNEG